MSKVRFFVTLTAIIIQSTSLPSVVNAQFSSAPFSPQILPCSYGNGEQCGFGPEDESGESQPPIRKGKVYRKSLTHLTRKQIRYLINNDRVGLFQFVICDKNGDKNFKINGHRLTSNEIAMFSQELGCSQLSSNNQKAMESMNQGIKLHKSGLYTLAMSNYDSATVAVRNYYPAYVNRGLILYESGNIDGAITAWRKALSILEFYPNIDPNVKASKSEASLALATALYMNKDLENAKKLMKYSLELDNRFSDTNFLKQNLWGSKLISDSNALMLVSK